MVFECVPSFNIRIVLVKLHDENIKFHSYTTFKSPSVYDNKKLYVHFTPKIYLIMPDTSELARGYTYVNSTQYKATLHLLHLLNITPATRILDIGCGPGNLTAHIASLVGTNGAVIGIDPSKSRIALALDLENHGTNVLLYSHPLHSQHATHILSTGHLPSSGSL